MFGGTFFLLLFLATQIIDWTGLVHIHVPAGLDPFALTTLVGWFFWYRFERERAESRNRELLSFSEDYRRELYRQRQTEAVEDTKVFSGARVVVAAAFTFMAVAPVAHIAARKIYGGNKKVPDGWPWVVVYGISVLALWCLLWWMECRRYRAAEREAMSAGGVSNGFPLTSAERLPPSTGGSDDW